MVKDIVHEVKLYESQRKEFKKDVKEAYLSYIKTLYPMTWWFRGDSFFFFRPLIWGVGNLLRLFSFVRKERLLVEP